mmetsp:Transcript_37477/g.37038  ORF Transcript_37477/g.37038 Transcript_37477/m.37038 type:complete len:143 (-) Transcript_37477:103-531(-)|eukprot:CAMPEP_0197011036 /NCGR_PEP_ID=MMETSP1380-20130617/56861_1 /TAXON_ID=5936 /ORGANISM="Euplotes crassus, Strain CT5" /LENGTH=142 /DNA_ID=CAMNT_0042433395 /DNA_START=31 /DNA_END=459 /DNA_ORIENTATION=-
MKSIKRYAKYERKSEPELDVSSDKQGTYYQFLVERKVPNGTLRHIASLINVTYEFIPDNYQRKRQKLKEEEDLDCGSLIQKKENVKTYDNFHENVISEELNVLQNMELKMLKDRPRKTCVKALTKKRKSYPLYENLPFRGSD